MSSNIVCKRVNYDDPHQGKALTELLNAYAKDPCGGGSPLKDEVIENLSNRLSKIPHAYSFIAYASDKEDAAPAGLVNCFEAFSTFSARPLVNIHDMYVANEFRGRGISQALLAAAEKEARERGCCKMTLECLSKNHIALNAYKKSGYDNYELDPTHGVAMLFEKKLD